MKLTASNDSCQATPNLSHLLRLATVLESAYGAGIITQSHKQDTPEAGWTTEQFLSMSSEKSFYN